MQNKTDVRTYIELPHLLSSCQAVRQLCVVVAICAKLLYFDVLYSTLAKAFPIIYDRERARKAFDILLITREQEMKQLAADIGYPAAGDGWQEKILLFCLDVDKCFQELSQPEMADQEIYKCMTLLRMMARDRPLVELQKIQDLAYNIANDFKSLYEQQR